MRILYSRQDLKQVRRQIESTSIGFVATMGALHEGHRALIACSKKKCDYTMVSIFINPIQFNNPLDFSAYPRNEDEDVQFCKKHGVDFVYIPSPEEMYPRKMVTDIGFSYLGDVWEGEKRPGHFNGVGIVISKLLHQISPSHAFFGLKDYQQYALICNMTLDLDFDVKIVGVPTVRDADGLALSSRNQLLSEADRVDALRLNHLIDHVINQVKCGISSDKATQDAVSSTSNNQNLDIEYLECVHKTSLKRWQLSDGLENGVVIIAAVIGRVRLIDNKFLLST